MKSQMKGKVIGACMLGMAGMLGGVGMAQAVTIDGITFNAGDQFISNTIYESLITNPSTDVLTGVGNVSSISCNLCGGNTWIEGNNGMQLSFYFTGYQVSQWYGNDGTTVGWHNSADAAFDSAFAANAVAVVFSGGTVDFYAHAAGTLNPSGSPATDIANAQTGNLWLSYAAQSVDWTYNSGTSTSNVTGTLFGVAQGTGSVLNSGNEGKGYLNVTGGDAFSNFNTNSWTGLTNGGAAVVPGADAFIDQTVTLQNTQNWGLSGTGYLKTTAVPEPSTVAMLGLGLVALGVAVRKNKKKEKA